MILGVCGKIASGKSEILKILKKRGFYCIDADKIVHDLYQSGKAGAKRIEAVFGGKFLSKDGSVDRVKLRDAVFADENKLKLLNDIIHPLVYEEIAGILAKHGNSAHVAIEAVYFDENFLNDFVDNLMWVERSREEIMAVLVGEREFSRDLAEKAYDLIGKPSEQEIDFIVENDGDLSTLSSYLDCLKLQS